MYAIRSYYAETRAAIRAFQAKGAFLVSQTVLLKGVNDDASYNFV